ncbi:MULTISPECIES: hypothetical protein [Nocardia]|uniref:Uncharacterized protein n=1 Tax=Nocardia sputorum TaxID=2984338 RepID=A0ABN6U6Z8_9NOCA|nr:hypothetical protein [Nocardia sputorum]BDU00455.1 hypothetical protein IFM12276_34830 [Nocardia sputorum]
MALRQMVEKVLADVQHCEITVRMLGSGSLWKRSTAMSDVYAPEESKHSSVQDAVEEKKRTVALRLAKTWHVLGPYNDLGPLVTLANSDPISQAGEFVTAAQNGKFWGLLFY